MFSKSILLSVLLSIVVVSCNGGITPVEDINSNFLKPVDDNYAESNSTSMLPDISENNQTKSDKDIIYTQINERLNVLSNALVSVILSKIDIENEITNLVLESLGSTGSKKGVKAIETRRLLDYVSRTMSNQMMNIISSQSPEPKLNKLIYGLAQISAEVSIIAAMKDFTYVAILSKKQSVDTLLRRRRSIAEQLSEGAYSESTSINDSTPKQPSVSTVSNIQLTSLSPKPKPKGVEVPIDEFAVLPRKHKAPIRLMLGIEETELKSLFNETVLETDPENPNRDIQVIIISNKINDTDIQMAKSNNNFEFTNNENVYADIGFNDLTDDDNIEVESETEKNGKVTEIVDNKAKMALQTSGDVANLAAESIAALRKTLTASVEVTMAVEYAKYGVPHHRDLMLNLAKNAARTVGKEAKEVNSKSIDCEKSLKLAITYASQSKGAKLSHVASRVIIDAIAVSSIAKTMADVSSEIAMDALYRVTDFKFT